MIIIFYFEIPDCIIIIDIPFIITPRAHFYVTLFRCGDKKKINRHYKCTQVNCKFYNSSCDVCVFSFCKKQGLVNTEMATVTLSVTDKQIRQKLVQNIIEKNTATNTLTDRTVHCKLRKIEVHNCTNLSQKEAVVNLHTILCTQCHKRMYTQISIITNQ